MTVLFKQNLQNKRHRGPQRNLNFHKHIIMVNRNYAFVRS